MRLGWVIRQTFTNVLDLSDAALHGLQVGLQLGQAFSAHPACAGRGGFDRGRYERGAFHGQQLRNHR